MTSQMRPADVVLGLAAIALLALLSFDWFSVTVPVGGGVRRTLNLDVSTTGWGSLGWATIALLVLVCVLALVVVGMLAGGALDSRTLAPHVILAVLAPVATLVLVIVVLTKPGLGAGLPSQAVHIGTAAWLGLAASLVLCVACWRSLGSQRQEVPGRIVTPPSPPLPPPAAPDASAEPRI